MEQFIGLIIFFVAWILISAMKKNAKKQQEAAQKMRSNSQMGTQQANRPASTADEINKLIEMFTEGGFSTPASSPVTSAVESGGYDSTETYETTIEEGGDESMLSSYRSVNEYVPYSSSIAGYTSEENLISMLTIPPVKEEIINQRKNMPNPVLSDFELKKAVVYSAILEPKYF